MMDAETWSRKVNEVFMKYGVTNESFQEDAPEELESILEDYNKMAEQHCKLIIKFTKEDKPVYRSQMWFCPECGHRVNYKHSHCHWCGKRIGWK